MAEAMSETSASSWYDDTPITDEQIEAVRVGLGNGSDGVPVYYQFSRAVVRKMLAEIDRLRATQPPLTDEYGMRITYVSTRSVEGAIADTLDEALEALAAFDAKRRDDVLSRELIRREVGPWGGFEKWEGR